MIETTPLRRKLLDLAISGRLCRSAEFGVRSAEWKTVKLGDVCDILTGNVFDSKQFADSGIKICGGLIIAPDGIRWQDCKYWSSVDGLEQYTLQADDVVVALDRPWISTGTKVGRIKAKDLPCLLIQRTARLRSTLIDPLLLESLIASSAFKEHCVPTGSTVPHISHKDIASFEIPLPPLAEQKAIVKRLEELLALEREIAAESAALDDLIAAAKRKILQLAVSGKLSAECGVQSAEWKMVKLGDVFQHNTGKALNRRDDSGSMMPYLTTSNVYWDHFELGSLKQMPFTKAELEKCSVIKGDLLVCEGGDIGRANIWNFDYPVCCQNHLHRLRPIGDVLSRFGYFVLMHYKESGRIQGKGIGLQGLSSKVLHNIEIPLPPLTEQKEIVKRVEDLFAVLDAMKVS